MGLEIRTFLRSRSGHLLLAMAGVLAAGTLFQLWLAQSWDLENLESLEGARLRGIAATTAAHVDGAAHEAAVRAHPPRGTMRAWTDAPDPARDLHAQLANVAGHAGLGGPVSTLRLRDAARADVLAAPDAVHPDAMEAVASSGSTPAWRTSLAYRPEMAEALFEGVPAATQVRDREDRAMVGAYAPITDDAGRVVAILGVEHPFAAHQAGHDARSAAQVGSAILSGGIGLIILALAGRRFGQGLSVAEAAARTMASGDFKTPVDAGGFTEVTFLAGALEDVRTATAARFGQLEKLARQRAHQRDLALRGINPEAIRRRTAFAELGDAIDAAVSVGGRRPQRIHLVDLSYDEASILTTADIDLAPGTPLRVRIACKDSGQRVRLPATVFARMDQGETAVEYRVRLGVNGALVDFPFSVARIMNGRQAPRVAPTVEHPVRATLIAEGRRIPAEVVDVSSVGVGLRVQRPAATISRWGTDLRLELGLPGVARAVPFSARLARLAGADPTSTLLGLQLVAEEKRGDFASRQQLLVAYVDARHRADQPAAAAAS